MNRLFFETSSKISFVALEAEQDLTLICDESKKINGKLIETIDDLLQKKSLSMTDIDEFFICLGPGSFTGIRLGLSLVKALVYSLKKPLLTTTSFNLYRKLSKTEDSLIIFSATRDLYYNAFYRGSELLFPPSVLGKEEIKFLLDSLDSKEKMTCISDVEVDLDLPTLILDPKKLLDLNLFEKVSTEKYSEEAIFKLEPYYLRASQAEANSGIYLT